MKEIHNQTLESLIGTMKKSNLPGWVQNVVVVSEVLNPLLDRLAPFVPIILAKLMVDLLLKLLGS